MFVSATPGLRRSWIAIGACCVAASCAASAPTPVEPLPVAVDDWRSETIELPPAFAPGLPSGRETLLFAPGFFDAGSEEHWAYAFVARMDAPALDADALDEWLEDYYDGLLTLVAEGSGRDAGADPADVRVQSLGDGAFRADVDLVDAFGTYERVGLRLVVECAGSEETVLRVQACRQEEGHPLWRSLAAAVERIEALQASEG